jgi:hypothetical protein
MVFSFQLSMVCLSVTLRGKIFHIEISLSNPKRKFKGEGQGHLVRQRRHSSDNVSIYLSSCSSVFATIRVV